MLRRLLFNGQMGCSAGRCRRIPQLIARAFRVATASGRYFAIFMVQDSSACGSTCNLAHPFLTESYVEGEELEYPLHTVRFIVRTGKALCEPACVDLNTFAVKVRDGGVYADVPA